MFRAHRVCKVTTELMVLLELEAPLARRVHRVLLDYRAPPEPMVRQDHKGHKAPQVPKAYKAYKAFRVI